MAVKPCLPADDQLLGTIPDREAARLLGRSLQAVIQRRSRIRKIRSPNSIDTFWSRVQKAEPQRCWNWLAGRDPNGYGNFSMGGLSYRVHRFSWELAHGAIGDRTIYVCHRCDNPSCVNPKHLFLGTNRDNIRDSVKKLRRRQGGLHHNAKLDGSKVREIRRLLAGGDHSQRTIGRMFGVARGTIAHIAQGKTRRFSCSIVCP
jgi:hypothetical protein